MKKIRTKSGYVAYEVTRGDLTLIGSPGICDECCAEPASGYLVPVMNRYLCADCYREWDASSRYYESDIPIEKKNAAYYESRIPMAAEPEGIAKNT